LLLILCASYCSNCAGYTEFHLMQTVRTLLVAQKGALASLPIQLVFLLHVRLNSKANTALGSANEAQPPPQPSSSNAFPFPTSKNPTPHEVFHFRKDRPLTAGQIKARYYELVRVHHPDSVHAQTLPPDVRHSRFQAITAAYNVLTGRSPIFGSSLNPRDRMYEQELARRRAYAAARGERYHSDHYPQWVYRKWSRRWNVEGETWGDGKVMFFGILMFATLLLPFTVFSPAHHWERKSQLARKAYADAVRDRKEYGRERRHEIRQRVEESKRQGDLEDKDRTNLPDD